MRNKTAKNYKGGKARKRTSVKNKKRAFTKKQYNSGDGMLTTVWGPGLWHYLHTMSFNYPGTHFRSLRKMSLLTTLKGQKREVLRCIK